MRKDQILSAQQRIADALAGGQTVWEVDDEIITPLTGLSEDGKAALFLYAWSMRLPERARADATAMALDSL
jgi:hypothetical protein